MGLTRDRTLLLSQERTWRDVTSMFLVSIPDYPVYNIAILIHGVSLSLRGSGRLDTRLDTPSYLTPSSPSFPLSSPPSRLCVPLSERRITYLTP